MKGYVMNKRTITPRTAPVVESSPWETESLPAEPVAPAAEVTVTVKKLRRPAAEVQPVEREFDLEGLMTDFPTARDLERFVYDETGIVLTLKGRANRLKYQVALDTLNGVNVEAKYVGRDNPYLDKTDCRTNSTLHLCHTRMLSIIHKVARCTACSASTSRA